MSGSESSTTPISLPIAVVVSRTRHETLHAGVAFQAESGEFFLFHQAFHYRTLREPLHQGLGGLGGPWRISTPPTSLVRATAIAEFWEFVAAIGEPIGYALRYDPDAHFDNETGLLVLPNGVGLSCSTFVLALFNSVRLPLIDTTGWPNNRPEDVIAQQELIRLLNKVRADESHLLAVRQEIGCERIRPEEVGGAAEQTAIPVQFSIAGPAGERIRQNLMTPAN